MTSGGGPSRNVPVGCYTVSQAANITGVSPDTLRRWRKTKVLVPSEKRRNGKLWVYLWTDADLEKVRQLIKHAKREYPTEGKADGKTRPHHN